MHDLLIAHACPGGTCETPIFGTYMFFGQGLYGPRDIILPYYANATTDTTVYYINQGTTSVTNS